MGIQQNYRNLHNVIKMYNCLQIFGNRNLFSCQQFGEKNFGPHENPCGIPFGTTSPWKTFQRGVVRAQPVGRILLKYILKAAVRHPSHLVKCCRLTFDFKYLRKKSRRKDLPCRKAPATEMTTTYLSLISSLKSTFFRAASSNVKVWSLLARTIGTACGFIFIEFWSITSKTKIFTLNLINRNERKG